MLRQAGSRPARLIFDWQWSFPLRTAIDSCTHSNQSRFYPVPHILLLVDGAIRLLCGLDSDQG
jgi:hypothetical protein